jgi:glycosyltransferase involved in cell wall biosynthesis
MIVRNEASKPWLKMTLEAASTYVDKFVILDDKSDDNGKTKELCLSFPKVMFFDSPYAINMYPIDEGAFRVTQWDYTRAHAREGDWILALDSDDVFEEKFKQELPSLMSSSYDFYRFRILDMWDMENYRKDGLWSPYITCLFKYKNEPAGFAGKMHIPLLPKYILGSTNGCTRDDIRLRHYGWVDEYSRESKVKFYVERSEGFNIDHALSVLQPATLAKA